MTDDKSHEDTADQIAVGAEDTAVLPPEPMISLPLDLNVTNEERDRFLNEYHREQNRPPGLQDFEMRPSPATDFQPFGPFAERVTERERPPYVTGEVDVAEFVKAQTAFITALAFFLQHGRKADPEYMQHLTNYSLSQQSYIDALTEILHQLGVV